MKVVLLATLVLAAILATLAPTAAASPPSPLVIDQERCGPGAITPYAYHVYVVVGDVQVEVLQTLCAY
jgi:hypothetical protein